MKSLSLAFILGASLLAAQPPSPGPRLPRPVGNMVFNSPAGKISMDKYKGKVTVLMFFLSDCSHCIEMAKMLSQVLAERHNDFSVVGVALDDAPQAAVAAFVRKNRIQFPVGWAGKDEFFKYTDLPSNTVPSVPVVLFIDKDFEVNRQYAQNHAFFTIGALSNTRGIVNMLARTAPGKAKDLPRVQSVAPTKAAAKQ